MKQIYLVLKNILRIDISKKFCVRVEIVCSPHRRKSVWGEMSGIKEAQTY